jgi:hypothetical protein
MMARSTAVHLLSWVAVCGITIAVIPAAYAGTLKSNNPPYTVGSQTFGLSIGGTVGAGGFSGTFDGNPIQFWCAELTQFFTPGNSYVYTESLPNNATFTMLGRLFHEAYGIALSDTQHSAAFQLAIWEILYDNDLDLLSGGFMVTDNHGHATTVALAQGWLDSLGSYTDNYDVLLLSNEAHQDFITPGLPHQDAPEPASGWLACTGLAALAIVSMRRRRSAATTGWPQ